MDWSMLQDPQVQAYIGTGMALASAIAGTMGYKLGKGVRTEVDVARVGNFDNTGEAICIYTDTMKPLQILRQHSDGDYVSSDLFIEDLDRQALKAARDVDNELYHVPTIDTNLD